MIFSLVIKQPFVDQKMGKGFGQLYKLRGIVFYKLSPFEQKAFANVISHGVPNTFRRIMENVPYMAPRKYSIWDPMLVQ